MGVEPGAEVFEWREPESGTKGWFRQMDKIPSRPMIFSWKRRASRSTGTSACIKSKTSHCNRGSGSAAGARRFNSSEPKVCWGMYVVEVPGAGALNAERHLYEEIYYVVDGRGTTEVWQEGSKRKLTFEWSRGSLFAIPLNAWHQVVNATSSPALLLAATTAPNIINLIRDADFVMNCSYNFLPRFDASDDYFRPVEDIYADPVRGLAMRKTNVIPDILTCELPPDNRRAFDFRRIEPHMAGANFYMKIGQYQTGQYSKAHKHASGAILVCIKGKGYSYTWPDRLGMQPWEAGQGDQVKKQTYEPVGMISAAPMAGDWFHQHFGTHPDGLRLLIFDGPYGPGFRRGGAPGEACDGRRRHRHAGRRPRHILRGRRSQHPQELRSGVSRRRYEERHAVLELHIADTARG